jgi:glycerophosphoryl diester phosphodiesterase
MTPSFWDTKTPIAIAHRGGDGAGAAKENTLEAFQAAQDMGYGHAETDVIMAASGELVSIHGARNWLQAGVSRKFTRNTLQKMTLDQMRYALRPGGADVPTLEELLITFPKMKFVLDVKTDQAAVPLAKLVRRLKINSRVCVTSFHYRQVRLFVEALKPQTSCTGLTIGRSLRLTNMNMLMVRTGRLSGIDAIFMHHSLVSGPMVNLIHRRGFRTIVWTANSPLSIKHAVRSGTDGIISDRIELLREIIESKKEH